MGEGRYVGVFMRLAEDWGDSVGWSTSVWSFFLCGQNGGVGGGDFFG